LENLEERIVLASTLPYFSTLAYVPLPGPTVSVTLVAHPGTGVYANTPLDLDVYVQNGFLVHSGDNNTNPPLAGGDFVTGYDWASYLPGVQTLPNNPGNSLRILENGVVTTLTVGNPNLNSASSGLIVPITQSQQVGTDSGLVIDDSVGALPAPTYSYDGSTFVGPGGNTNVVYVNATNTLGVVILGGTGTDTFNITGTSKNEPVFVVGGPKTNTVNIGNNNSLSSIYGPVVITNPTGSTTVNVFDSKDKKNTSASLDMNSPFTTGPYVAPYELTGLSKGIIAYGEGVTALNIYGGTAGICWNVSATQLGTVTDLYTNGDDQVFVTNDGLVADILGDLYITNTGWKTLTDLIIDDSNDLNAVLGTLTGGNPTSTFTGFTPASATISYNTASLNSLTIDGGAFSELAVDFAAYNPVPIPQLDDVPGLSFNGTPGGFAGLILYGSNTTNPFLSETNNASDLFLLSQKYGNSYTPFYGDIQLTDSLNSSYYIEYTGLAPVTDIVPVENYTFNDYGYPDQSFEAYNYGPYTTPDDSQTITEGIVFASTPPDFSVPTFEGTLISDKTNVTFNAPALLPIIPQQGLTGNVDIPNASDGLQYLQFNAPTNGNNTVTFEAVPNIAVGSGYTGSSGNDTTYVTGTGVSDIVPPSGFYSLYLNGAGGQNTLVYDAGGETPTVEPDGFGGVLISIPGYGVVDAINYQTISIINAGQGVITPGIARTINTVEGFQNVDTITATFTATAPLNIITTPPVIPDPTIIPATLPASDFTASIDWGDPPQSDNYNLSAGTVTQDAAYPTSTYYVTGQHIYVLNGTYTINTSARFLGGSYTYTDSTLVPGVTVSVSFSANTAPTPLTPSTAKVTQGTLAVSVFPVVGTEGQTIANAPIATFIDAGSVGQPANAGNYSALAYIVTPGGLTSLGIPTTIAPTGGDAAEYTISAAIPGADIPESGTYQLVVVVTDNSGATPTTVEGAALAVIQDAALTPGTIIAGSQTTGTAYSGGVATFTDANLFNVATDFTATIDWGDGSPNSVGTVVGSDGSFTVDGTHTYLKFNPSYKITVTVREVDGSLVTISGNIAVTDPTVTGFAASPAIKATEGLSTGTIVLGTFTYDDPYATVSDVSAYLSAGGWGDGSPAGTTYLTVQEMGANASQSFFEILGSHTYAEEGPYTLSINVATLGGSTTTITDPVTVLDAPLTSSNGTTITGTEGLPTGTVLLGSFTDANQYATTADYTSGGGSVVVLWGDGSAPQTLTAGNLTELGSPNGVIFTVNAGHTYAEEGEYAITVTVTDDGGATTVFSSYANISDAPLTAAVVNGVFTTESPVYPVPEFGAPIFTGTVGAFTDANPTAPLSDFTATIDWGDGTPNSVGTISQPQGIGTTFVVTGSHTYASSGPAGYTYPITVYVTDVGGSKVTLTNTATVAANAITITGILNPLSDSGKSNTDAITNIAQPNFYGTSQPFSNITLYATPVGTTATFVIGHVEAGSDGSWSITSNHLADGQYLISATATDQFGLNPTGQFVITPVLTVDTQPPVITNLTFDRFDATLTVTYQDGLSGLDLASITNSAFYHISATPLASYVHVPKMILPTQIYYTPGALPTDPVVVNVVFNNGHMFRGGKYHVVINSGTGDTGIQDVAGNALDGNYYGTLPSGDLLAGGNFVADIYTFHNTILPFVPIQDGYSPPPKGIDPPAGAKLPKAPVAHRAKNLVVTSNRTTTLLATKAAKAKAVDAALAELVIGTKGKKS
jgi:hypothetical protein